MITQPLNFVLMSFSNNIKRYIFFFFKKIFGIDLQCYISFRCTAKWISWVLFSRLSCVWLFATPWTAVHQASLSITNSRSRWCHATISSSVIPFSSCLQSFPASGSFPMSQFFPSGGQSIGVSAAASVLPMNTQDWSPLGWTGWISLQSKGLSRVFSNTTYICIYPLF